MSDTVDVVTPAFLRGWALPQASGSKHSRGHFVAVGASRSTPGALLLSGVAGLRVGAGVLALAAPDSVAVQLALVVPESAVVGYPDEGGWSDRLTELVHHADAITVGPGLDDPGITAALLESMGGADLGDAAVVLDAFALGVIAQDSGLVPHVGGPLVLTPNRSEAARLLGMDEDDLSGDAAAVALDVARRWSAVVSFGSAVAAPDGRRWVVPSGHPGLGTSGSGDVLAGAVGGLLARGASGEQAAIWATYLHAAAGDRLAPRVGRLGFLARELLDELPAVLTEVQA
jgi:hydroxyethylthiazole kinase-like uncharacterized protein yjeF